MSEVGFKGVPSDKPAPRTPVPPARLSVDAALAVHEVVERTSKDLWPIAWFGSNKDRGLAEDAVQQTYLKLVERWPGNLALKSERELLNWLRGTVKRTLFELIRKRTGRGKVFLTPKGDVHEFRSAAGPHDDPVLVDDIVINNVVLAEIRVDDVLKVVAQKLQGQQRAVFELLVQGLETREIAAQLGIKQPTVRSHLMLARRALRKDPTVRDFFEKKEG